MNRLSVLPVGLKVKNTNGYDYLIIAQNENYTLLFRNIGYTKYVVAYNLFTDDRHYPDEFYDISNCVDPFVSWQNGQYFEDLSDAYKYYIGKTECNSDRKHNTIRDMINAGIEIQGKVSCIVWNIERLTYDIVFDVNNFELEDIESLRIDDEVKYMYTNNSILTFEVNI